ncbi:nitroreductase/NAD-dependent dihydropyrimidine dehydrogenase PreA subunit [Methanomicrobium sp. W14]|uniref:nitroreductase family protein n=1 Tax=Methanomicrobium sp. W14 TaxID=2817839 RepID=UPI001AE398BD|nr:nitroreductase family protein [Methanomicrobium sp. W14]MBP2134188.1 nitroreductase/NAD-dependent dihydropyrimidine dehydrogenase PreA subunit [Methanomicrobium sp. W14]
MDTITVDGSLCTKCGTCSEVCPMGIVIPAGKNNLPYVEEGMSGLCILCGHCEAFCPEKALKHSFRPDDREYQPEGTGEISPEDIDLYLKKRRSVRLYTKDPVQKEKIAELLDIARYAPSGGNGQTVEWIVVYDFEKVRRIAELTIEWMKTLVNVSHPMSGLMGGLITAFEGGNDVICRNAPHLLFAHIPEGNPVSPVDAIIALTNFDVAAPAFGIGTCWAGFVSMAASSYKPLQDEIGIPDGRKVGYAVMFGYPRYQAKSVPGRNPVKVTWI